MKRVIVVLLIALLSCAFAFAKLTGSAGVKFEENIDKETLSTTNTTSFNFTYTFASDKVKINSKEDVHVEVAATAKFILGSRIKGDGNGIRIGNGDRGIGAVITLTTAKIVGKNWYVSVLGTQDAYDYAKAAVLTITNKETKDAFGNVKSKDSQVTSYALAFEKTDGVTIGYDGFTASFGIENIKDFTLLGSATVETPEFAFKDDAIKFQAAAQFGRFKIADKKTYVAVNALGVSARTTATIKDITLKAAFDMGLENFGQEVGTGPERETQFNIDGRFDFKYSFVNASIYAYAGGSGLKFGKAVKGVFNYYKDFYLEAKAVFDLNTFELPFKVTVSAKNITNSEVAGNLIIKGGVVPSVKVEFAKDAIKAAASYSINTETKAWSTLVYGIYAFEKFTVGAGTKVAGDSELTQISVGAFVETDKLVKGAKFGLSYGLNGDTAYSDGCAKALTGAKFTSNYKKEKNGTANAYCKITF
ncbi:MAG: hypothetical protein J6P81_03155 [Spirochaetales bacterium]|nr:hypothetical protein [Spirochaetales bacterium]